MRRRTGPGGPRRGEGLAKLAAAPGAGLGEAAARFEREEVPDGRPPEPRMQISVDGAGVPMRREETEGVRGRQADGTSRTREARLAVICTAEGRDPGTGAAVRAGAANPSPA